MTAKIWTILLNRQRKEKRDTVKAALEKAGWRITFAAEALGVPAASLRHTVRSVGLEKEYLEKSPGRGR